MTAALILTDVIEPWMVFGGTLTGGASQAFNHPARVSLIPRIVPRENVTNAIALTSAAFNTLRTLGPAPCFWLSRRWRYPAPGRCRLCR